MLLQQQAKAPTKLTKICDKVSQELEYNKSFSGLTSKEVDVVQCAALNFLFQCLPFLTEKVVNVNLCIFLGAKAVERRNVFITMCSCIVFLQKLNANRPKKLSVVL